MVLTNHYEFVVGNGRRVHFREDKWCGREPLCAAFRSLCPKASSKGVRVAVIWDHFFGGVGIFGF